MKSSIPYILTTAFMIAGFTLTAQPSAGGFHVYYGHLHNHCNISDGLYSPDYAYSYAKKVAHLDFFSLADHSTVITPSEWTSVKKAAEKYNEPGIFTAFWGFEWTNYDEGHVTVINSTDCISTYPPTHNFTGLCTWLDAHECIAFFNHPGHSDEKGYEFYHFSTPPSDKFVGMELWNKTQRFERFYYTDGYYSNDGNLGWFDEALIRGWNIGATGSEDNHVGTWGTWTESRMAILANANTRQELMDAMKARRFFSTYDKNLALSFKIDGQEMGSTIPGGAYPVVIEASDGDNENFTRIELVKNGFVVNSWTPNSTHPIICLNLNGRDREFYYIRIFQQDGDQAISSPIRISGGASDLPPQIAATSAGAFSRSFTFNFSNDYEGWSGDFADYPAADSLFYELEFRRTALPSPLDISRNALMIKGNNHSDDLFMFIRKKITGLTPNKTYQLVMDVELASNAPTHAIGIGGPPGESVFLKAGASQAEPFKVLTNGFYLMNIDKSNQASPGADMDTIGNIGVSDTTTNFTLINRSNAGHPFTISTDASGEVWVCIGTDSGFEGTTTLYYSRISLSFEVFTGKEDTREDLGISIFPNPAKDILYIRDSQSAIRSIDLFNSQGQSFHPVFYSDRISLIDLPPGIYCVRIILDDQSRYLKKILIQN
jgi:hypothetical protein